ncbi:C4-dicarboxylate ABC transporter [Acidovorax sp. HDW3]|uniref:tellurite resistance/C4-dicarboxylate transporter family protein n=1 Tax=Acidovorax sp. HDW3 TaxID=2714923 RepID=UPI00140A7E48|nr:tellurite resistance/C4-dicarboxylate transporter family protein [Acidovorax sp. HDW3]QIL44915.1 C4-dicarboxylate ABC transporter [Acidovorax sp. HDW3]
MPPSPPPRPLAPVDAAPWNAPLAELSPAYFGLVMATGIIALGAHMMGRALLAQALLWLNLLQYAGLCLLYGLRAWCYPQQFGRDLIDHLRGPGFFTTVAASGILASQAMVQLECLPLGVALWALAVLLWLLLTYTIFAAFTVKQDKPPLDKGISGAWLLAVVATQSLAVSSCLLAARIGQPLRLELNLLALSMWLWGGMLYIWMMSLIFYRYTFFRFAPSDLSPPYWINMGAMAISTLAGALLIQNAPHAPFLAQLLPFVKGFTLLYWATGTWWIPMLLVLGIWRHVYRRFPLHYDPLYWGAVFPLGMYAASTWQMDKAMEFGFLRSLPQVFWWVALAAWALAFVGMLRRLVRSVLRWPVK